MDKLEEKRFRRGKKEREKQRREKKKGTNRVEEEDHI